jgi:hypothetical protein
MSAVVLRVSLLLAAIGFAACVAEPEAEPSASEQGSGAGLTAADVDPVLLRRGHRELLVDGLNGAENQLFTSTGRLLVSGDDGIFEVIRSASSSRLQAIHTGEPCAFGGLTEMNGTVYANCYDFTNSALFAAPLAAELQFRAIYQLPGIALANGLTNDGAGNLYVAASMESKIVRLRVKVEDPLAILAQDAFLEDSGLVTNGIKFFDGQLYWSAIFAVKAVGVKDGAASGFSRNLAGAWTLFDDLYVDASGVLVDDYVNGSLLLVDDFGLVRGATPNGVFDGPSSVQPAQGRLGLPADALIVTERNLNRVSLYVQ